VENIDKGTLCGKYFHHIIHLSMYIKLSAICIALLIGITACVSHKSSGESNDTLTVLGDESEAVEEQMEVILPPSPTTVHPQELKQAYPREEKMMGLEMELGEAEYDMISTEEVKKEINLNEYPSDDHPTDWNTEEYKRIYENPFHAPLVAPLSTFSIDVDVASYANIRRFISESRMPYPDAVRIEEMINYFDYDYQAPKDDTPFSVYTEMGNCPWNSQHQLLHIGLQGKEIAKEDVPPSNLVFLFDVSGSMDSPNKLPLLKRAFRLLVEELSEQDKVSIVVYAGAAGEVLPSTSADEKAKILGALAQMTAGGSTAGGAGIQLAYDIARKNFIQEGNNRVILATDGDFNVGASSEGELLRMIEQRREEGVFLSVLGFGTGNYKDAKMELLADKGNGNYAYIDNILEAQKVLIKEMGGTLYTIAKDVKLQLEFNPAQVKGYRLIGYENRVLAAQDFNDDKKDAGEMGAGHTVTALYEIVPVGADTQIPSVDTLTYQSRIPQSGQQDDLLTLKLRYKMPQETTSKLIKHVVAGGVISETEVSNDFRFSAAVAAWGMLMRRSEYKGTATYADVIDWAKTAKGSDGEGYRAECIRLMEQTAILDTHQLDEKLEARE